MNAKQPDHRRDARHAEPDVDKFVSRMQHQLVRSQSLVFMLLSLCCVWPLTGADRGEQVSDSSLSEEALRAIRFEQKLSAQVTLDLPFRDERGDDVRLDHYFGEKPVILVLGYYECPMLCSLVWNGMIEALDSIKLDVGRDFEVVVASIHPGETPELAAAQKRVFLKRYGRPDASEGLHFLTGGEPAIAQLADEVGFLYAYDSTIEEYAHPSGFVLLTPGGRVARYFFGVRFEPKDLDAALRQAGANRVGSRIEQFVLLCFHYSPLTGKYGELIMSGVRLSAAGTLLALGGVIVRLAWRRRKLAIDKLGNDRAGPPEGGTPNGSNRSREGAGVGEEGAS